MIFKLSGIRNVHCQTFLVVGYPRQTRPKTLIHPAGYHSNPLVTSFDPVYHPNLLVTFLGIQANIPTPIGHPSRHLGLPS